MADLYVVRSLNLMNDLVQQGYRCRKVEDSEIDPKLKVFFFDDTREVRNAIKQYQIDRRMITNGNKTKSDGTD